MTINLLNAHAGWSPGIYGQPELTLAEQASLVSRGLAVVYSHPLPRNGTTINIAPDNSDFKSQADLVCRGRGYDHETINDVLAYEIPEKGASVQLMAGAFSNSDELVVKCHNTALWGVGWGFWHAFVFASPNPAFPPGTMNPMGGLEGFGLTKIKQLAAGKNIIRIDNLSVGGDDARLHGISLSGMYLFGKDYTGTGIVCSDGNGHNTDQLIIEKMFIQRTRTGMDLFVDCPHVQLNTIMDIGGRGIVQRGNVFGFLNNNVIADNGDLDGGWGIEQLGGDDLTLSNNTFARVKGHISTSGGSRTKVLHNKGILARGIAFYINSNDTTVHDNTSNGSGAQAIAVKPGGAGSSVTENKLFDAGDHAVSVEVARAVKVKTNHIVNPVYCGVYLNGNSSLSTVVDNTIIGSGGDSIVSDSPNVQIKDNPIEITKPGVSGINVLQAGCSVTGNPISTTIANNAQKAIKASGGALTSLTVALNRSVDGSGSFTSPYTLPANGATPSVVNIGNV